MTEKEKKLLETLDTAARDVKIPEGLEPEKMEERLKGKKIKVWKRGYTYAAAAACLTVVIGGTFLWQYTRQGAASGNGSASGGANGSPNDGEAAVSEQIAEAGDYKDVYKIIEKYQSNEKERLKSDSGWGWGLFGGNKENSSSADTEEVLTNEAADAKMSGQAKTADTSGGYSDTNVRTEGVGEADIVKTDGTYLYALKESAAEIVVIDPSGDEMKQIASIKPGNDTQISEFYVNGNQLFVLGNTQRTKLNEEGPSFYYGEDAVMLTYDLSDIENPEPTDTLTQSGRYLSSRFVDGYLYLFSSFYVEGECSRDDISTYVPYVNGKAIPVGNIIMPPINTANQYTVVTSVKADTPGEIADQKAVLANNGECYVSTDNIYIYESLWQDADLRYFSSGCTTAVRRIAYKEGKLTGEAQGKVNGEIHDSFCIDEYDGYLRIVTTITGNMESSNAVYVLDETLTTVGKITDLAKGEQVYSARLLGETGYFVTYRQIDPLFSADFSDPENPKIIGTLKIPGFSEYLHPYGDGLLLGIGVDTDEESGVTNGVKISMFDISDPSDVKEVQKYIINGAYSSDVFNDYRAVLIDKEKNIIGFSTYGNSEMYRIFSYDEANGFNLEMEEEVNGVSYMGTRGVYIKDKLYVIKGNAVESYLMGDYRKVDDLLI